MDACFLQISSCCSSAALFFCRSFTASSCFLSESLDAGGWYITSEMTALPPIPSTRMESSSRTVGSCVISSSFCPACLVGRYFQSLFVCRLTRITYLQVNTAQTNDLCAVGLEYGNGMYFALSSFDFNDFHVAFAGDEGLSGETAGNKVEWEISRTFLHITVPRSIDVLNGLGVAPLNNSVRFGGLAPL
jgi:hypothetical protein